MVMKFNGLRFNSQKGWGYKLDRIDNNKGYFKENLLVCCKCCNFMKRSLSYEAFLKQITKIGVNLNCLNKL